MSSGVSVPQPSTAFSIEYVSSGVVREWSADRRLCIFNINNGYQETIDAWANDVKAVMAAWQVQMPCLLLHDFHKALGFNQFFGRCFETLFKSRPELVRSVGVIAPDDPVADTIRAIIEAQQTTVQSGATWKVFATRREALAWLYEQQD